MKVFKNITQTLVIVVLLTVAKLAFAVGIPQNLRMNLKYDNTQAEVKFTDDDLKEHKVKVCDTCKVSIWNDGEDSLPAHFLREGGRLSFIFLTGKIWESAFVSILDAQGEPLQQNGETYEFIRVHPAHPLKIEAESKRVNFINQYGGDGSNLSYNVDLQWVFGHNQTINVEMKPSEDKGPTPTAQNGYFLYTPDGATSIRFGEKNKNQYTQLAIHSGATEIFLECSAESQTPSIPCRAMAWRTEDVQSQGVKLHLTPYDGKDVYHPEFHQFSKLKIKNGAYVQEFNLDSNTQVSLVSGPAAAIDYTLSGSKNQMTALNGDAALVFSQTGNVIKLGVLGQTGGAVISANPKNDSPGIGASGSITGTPHCTHGCGPGGNIPNNTLSGQPSGPDGEDDDVPTDDGQNGADGSQGVDVGNAPESASGCSVISPAASSKAGAIIAMLLLVLPLAARRIKRNK